MLVNGFNYIVITFARSEFITVLFSGFINCNFVEGRFVVVSWLGYLKRRRVDS